MLARIAQPLRDAMRRTLWKQWTTLGAGSPGAATATAMVDPEALVLSSLSLWNYEPRLRAPLGGLAVRASGLMSVQRIKNLAARYPPGVAPRLASFAELALEQGRDYRWRSLRGDAAASWPAPLRSAEALEFPDLLHPAALVLRLRLGVGVGIKADMLARLLGSGGAWCDVRDLAAATAYSDRAVRRGAEDLVAARLLHASSGTPARYRLDAAAWGSLLELSRPLPPWRHWGALLPFVAHVLEWASQPGADTTSPYVLGERAAGLLRGHLEAFELNRIALPRRRPGAAPADAELFEGAIQALVAWLRESV